MDKMTLKDRLFYLWLVLIVGAMYAENAYEKIYYLRNNVNFPHRWTVFWIILSVFIITLIAIAISNKKNNVKNEASFGRSFLIAFAATTFTRFIGNKTDSIMRHAVDIDKAAMDIIRWYVFGFVTAVIICVISDFWERKRKKHTADTSENSYE